MMNGENINPLDEILIRSGGARIVLNVEYAYADLLDHLSEIDKLIDNPEFTVIKDQKKVKVVRADLTVSGAAVSSYLKKYKCFSIRKKLEGTILPSRALRAWNGARRLLANGIRTADPIAAIEIRKFGLLRKSYYVTKAIPDAEISVHYFGKAFTPEQPGSQRLRREFVRSLARSFRRLHETNIYHSDLKDYNILIGTNGSQPFTFWLLDVECVKGFRGITDRRKLKNLVQINRTLGEKMKMTDRLAFLKEYLQVGTKQRLTEEQKDLVRKVSRRSRLVFLAGRRRR